MRRLLDLRVTDWPSKLLWVIGAVAVSFLAGWALLAVTLPSAVAVVLVAAIDIAMLFLLSRIFRVAGEPVRPARAWWRMTGRVRLSVVLGVLFLLFAVLSAGSVWSAAMSDRSGAGAGVYLSALEYGVFGFFYLNSAVRLRRQGEPVRPPVFARP